MYEDFYRLNKKPFEPVATIDDWVPLPSQQQLLKAILFGLQQSNTMISLVGSSGLGKTMLMRVLMKKLRSNYLPMCLANPNCNAEDVYLFLNDALGLPIDSCADVNYKNLFNYIRKDEFEKRPIVLCLDEGHLVSREFLDTLRMLADIKSHGVSVFRVIVFAHHKFECKLRTIDYQAFANRINAEYSMNLLCESEAKRFFYTRLLQASNEPTVLFEANAVEYLLKKTYGNLRAIQTIGDKSMWAGYSDCSQFITKKHVNQAIRETSIQLSRVLSS